MYLAHAHVALMPGQAMYPWLSNGAVQNIYQGSLNLNRSFLRICLRRSNVNTFCVFLFSMFFEEWWDTVAPSCGTFVYRLSMSSVVRRTCVWGLLVSVLHVQ